MTLQRKKVDVPWLTVRRDSAVKHLRTCHDRVGSITQADRDSWSRLREINSSLPTSCPPLPMNANQYRAASRCGSSSERPATNISLPISIKRIRTTERPTVVEPPAAEQQPTVTVRPEQPPIVRVEQRVVLRRRLARLREDFQAVSRLKEHMESDMKELERQLGKRPRH